jgi:ribose transport system permease protein
MSAVAIAAGRLGIDKPVAIAFGCIVLLLVGGALYNREFLSPQYLLQQMQIAAFLGVIASGAMMVILLGHIDLSVPWVVTLGAMMATALPGWVHGTSGVVLAIPFGIVCGALVGLLNGLGVAYLCRASWCCTPAASRRRITPPMPCTSSPSTAPSWEFRTRCSPGCSSAP